jgi:hypothetical protein
VSSSSAGEQPHERELLSGHVGWLAGRHPRLRFVVVAVGVSLLFVAEQAMAGQDMTRRLGVWR